MVDRVVGGHNHHHGHEVESSNGHEHTCNEESNKNEKTVQKKQEHSEVRKRGNGI